MTSFMKETCFSCEKCNDIFYTKNNLKKHSRVEHENSCIHCGKTVKHAKNRKLHERSCDKNPYQRNETNRQTNTYNHFELVQSAFDKTLAVYRRTLSSLEDFNSALHTDVPNLLKREAEDRIHFKWYTAIKVIYRKALRPDVKTDPPVCFRTSARLGLLGTDYESFAARNYQDLMEQIQTYTTHGSGWIFDHFQELDITIISIANTLGKDSDSE